MPLEGAAIMNFSDLRIFLCTTPTSMTYSFDRLMGLALELLDFRSSSMSTDCSGP